LLSIESDMKPPARPEKVHFSHPVASFRNKSKLNDGNH
jgi:hypothetical protein